MSPHPNLTKAAIDARNGALGTGKGFGEPLVSCEARTPKSGLLRLYWRRTGGLWVSGSIPRVKITWSAIVGSRGISDGYSMVADAMSGVFILNATSVNMSMGWLDDDTPGGAHLIQATLFDLPGGADSESYVTFTQPVDLGASRGVISVNVPPSAEAMYWFDPHASNVEIIGIDPAGTPRSLNRTGAPVAGAPVIAPMFPVAPSVAAGGTVTVDNLSGVATAGELVFYLEGQSPQ